MGVENGAFTGEVPDLAPNYRDGRNRLKAPETESEEEIENKKRLKKRGVKRRRVKKWQRIVRRRAAATRCAAKQCHKTFLVSYCDWLHTQTTVNSANCREDQN